MTIEYLHPRALPLPLDEPFLLGDALKTGVTSYRLRQWVHDGSLKNPLRGVYHLAALPDSLDLRVRCLQLVLARGAVITDRTAAWLHGATMALEPNSHVEIPAVSISSRPGNRLRNALVTGGERRLAASDVVEISGLLVTSPLRTACDLGRLLHRDQAFAALDAMLRLGAFAREELLAETARFKGYRGVRQLRELAPDADGRSASPGESILRRRWLDCPSLPRPQLQVEVQGPHGMCYLDLAAPEVGYAAEYDGVAFHGQEHEAHDKTRRDFLERDGAWLIDVFTGADLHGPTAYAEARLRLGVARTRFRRPVA